MSYFHLLLSGVITEGYRRSLLHDTQTGKSRLLSREIAAALKFFSGRKTAALCAHLSQLGMADDDITALLDMLSTEGFILLSPVRISFQPLSNDFDLPFTISNAIIDIASTNRHLLPQMLHSFRSVTCPYLQLRVYASVVPDEDLLQWITAFAATDTVNTIELVMPFFESYHLLPERVQPAALAGLVLYSADRNDMQVLSNRAQVLFMKDVLALPGSCGIVDVEYFNFRLQHYTEAQHHNSCLNRKISIDQYGNIKNCPSMAIDYGNVCNVSLASVAAQPSFRKVWRITKDQVAACRNCEFRYVCTDCRAYLEVPDDINSKPLKCGYDPYTCTWEEWSTHPAKQQAIAYYGMSVAKD